jgi:surface antigen
MNISLYYTKTISILLATTLILGCAGNKQGIGAGVGAITGGLLGSSIGGGSGNVVATIIGAGAGALIGGAIGQELDEKDKKLMHLKTQQALETSTSGSSVQWHNPDNGNKGVITPTRTFKAGQGQNKGQYCREFTQTITIGGTLHKAYGTACRAPDGSWQIQPS